MTTTTMPDLPPPPPPPPEPETTTSKVTTQASTSTAYTCPANQIIGDLSKTNASLSATIYEIVNNVKNNIGSSIYVGNNGFTPSKPGSSIFIDLPTTASSFVS